MRKPEEIAKQESDTVARFIASFDELRRIDRERIESCVKLACHKAAEAAQRELAEEIKTIKHTMFIPRRMEDEECLVADYRAACVEAMRAETALDALLASLTKEGK